MTNYEKYKDQIDWQARAGAKLDKIKAEIDRQEKWLMSAGYNAYNVDIAFNSIRSAVKESEDKE